jgi:hypothetical protein
MIVKKTTTNRLSAFAERTWEAGNLIADFSKCLGFVSFYTQKPTFNYTSQEYEFQDAPTHTIAFSEAEKSHLRKGGTIAIMHACGNEVHVTIPKPWHPK